MRAVQRRCELARRRLEELAKRPPGTPPAANQSNRLRDLERRLDEWSGRLQRAMRVRSSRAKQVVESAAGRLETLSALNC